MNDPQETRTEDEATLSDEEIETGRMDSAPQSSVDDEDDTGDDTGDDSGDVADPTDSGDDSGDDTGDDSSA